MEIITIISMFVIRPITSRPSWQVNPSNFIEHVEVDLNQFDPTQEILEEDHEHRTEIMATSGKFVETTPAVIQTYRRRK